MRDDRPPLGELQRDLAVVPEVFLSRAHLWRVLKPLGLRFKSLHAAERDTHANRIRREQEPERIPSRDGVKLIFLDESGVSTQMTWHFARSLKGAGCTKPSRRQREDPYHPGCDELARHDRHDDG